ncbi:sulfurtransferase [Clostridia bacterium]|nr:sulfurtransferase [Clostridia bacterium]
MNTKKIMSLVLVLVITLSMVACSNGSAEVKETAFEGEYMIDGNTAKEQFEAGNAILVDARGEDAAKGGTVEGAIATTWQYLSNVENVELGDYDWGLILQPEELATRLGNLGLSKDKEIILFAEGPKGWGEDARILWTLRAAGYDQLKMVDGGLNALLAAGLSESKDVTKLDPVEVKIDALDYEYVVNTNELEAAIDDYVIIDVREDKEYEGGVYYGEAQGGHLPGAIQIKFTDLFDEDGYLKSNDDINSMFADAGVTKDDQIVAYCTAGIRSAYMQLVLEMLGYDNAQNYDGSYYTWCAHNDVEM